ncbi:hypothetical protein SDC9_178843 [bioreactor metagenome]|uniref:Uncharacterized protein n=1 Tax=bioreactor metagenome TaxID=1076179 RepID=A0A645H059_9ZZZZ
MVVGIEHAGDEDIQRVRDVQAEGDHACITCPKKGGKLFSYPLYLLHNLVATIVTSPAQVCPVGEEIGCHRLSNPGSFGEGRGGIVKIDSLLHGRILAHTLTKIHCFTKKAMACISSCAETHPTLPEQNRQWPSLSR